MIKTFTYKIETKRYYIPSSDEYESDYIERKYTPDDNELKDAIIEEVFYTYLSKKERNSFSDEQTRLIKSVLRRFTEDNDNWDKLADDFESELQEAFEQDAIDFFEE